MRTLKSIGAILAGFIFIFVTSVLTDILLEKNGLMTIDPFSYSASWVIVLIIICRCAYSITGSYLTARLAPSGPMLHAMVLGVIGSLVSIGGAMMMWDKSPHWLSIVLIVLPILCAWVGGKLKK